MDGLGRSSGHHGVVKKEEKRLDHAQSTDQDSKQTFDHMKSARHEYTDISDDDTKQSSPKQVETTKIERISSSLRQKEKLESTKAEMSEVLEENERLKKYLDRIVKDYRTLKKQFEDVVVVQQEAVKSLRQETEESELISLSLGSFSGASAKMIKDEKNKSPSNHENVKDKSSSKEECLDREGLSLGLDCKFVRELSNRSGATEQGGPARSNPSGGSSFEEAKEEAGETWPPSKALKPVAKRSGEQDEVSQAQNPAKKARVCVRARCDTPTMIDGCQWRKYGQKIAKGNPCPRAYYRCTVAPLCPVRKQVQRCAEDMSVLITTYEGSHNHALPAAATAMASTTSAAASMLLSGSSSSSSVTARRPSEAGLGFTTFDSFKWNNSTIKPQFHLPNAFSSSHPTVTLDLTSSTLNKISSSSSSPSMAPSYHHLNSSNVFPATSLSFGSSESSLPWSHHHGFFNYNSSSPQQVQGFGLKNQMQNPSGNYFQNYMQQKMVINPGSPNPSVGAGGPDLAAATKAITADPAFQSALAAALTSIIGGGGGGQVGNLLPNEVVQNLMRSGDQRVQFPAGGGASGTAGTPAASFLQGNINIAGCASTFLKNTGTASAGSQPAAGSLMFLSSNNSVSFSSPKSASSSPGDTRDHQQTSPN